MKRELRRVCRSFEEAKQKQLCYKSNEKLYDVSIYLPSQTTDSVSYMLPNRKVLRLAAKIVQKRTGDLFQKLNIVYLRLCVSSQFRVVFFANSMLCFGGDWISTEGRYQEFRGKESWHVERYQSSRLKGFIGFNGKINEFSFMRYHLRGRKEGIGFKEPWLTFQRANISSEIKYSVFQEKNV